MQDGDIEKAQLGLAHSYSRSKVKFNVNRVDNMIIQSISLLDTLDKDINTFCMRVRYASAICSCTYIDNYTYVVPLHTLIALNMSLTFECIVYLMCDATAGSGTHGIFPSW